MSVAVVELDARPKFPVSVFLLTIAQGLAGAIPPIMVSLGGMVGQTLTANELLVTLPISMFMIGTCTATIPVAMLIRLLGRKPVYCIGAVVSMIGGLTCTLGVLQNSFLLFCLGAFLFGLNIACVQSYRFAATLLVRETMRPRAISFVLAGGLVSAVVGPQIVVWTSNVVIGAPFALSFLCQALLALSTLPALLLLRFPAMSAPLRKGAVTSAPPSDTKVSLKDYVLAVICGAVSYASMSFTMTASPLAIIACGFTVDDAAHGIQWHILGMFAPSFVTGRLIERFGHQNVMLFGIALVAVGAVIALSGQELAHFWATLILLGVGWNFSFTGSSVMIARSAVGPRAVLLQGIADFSIFGFVAISSLSAGALIHLAGWSMINWIVVVATGLTTLPFLYQATTKRNRTVRG
ncbi:MFS family permease [Rhizobium petrolearium]|uniref:MFS transporter n=1 Tax=Neorhizobium petrolearium TaxID=515361 RepID=UPI001AE1C104|nr:MFS transporter [Neorhizobium petrolearium]MBP1845783.1 MFS family permease [Neorhizobium petrolearium]